MQRFTKSIQASLSSENWFAALFLALALPDICGALETPNHGVGERYKNWYNRFMRAKYDPSNCYEGIANSIPPDELKRLYTQEQLDVMKLEPINEAMQATKFTAANCYNLRYKCLHQGLPDKA